MGRPRRPLLVATCLLSALAVTALALALHPCSSAEEAALVATVNDQPVTEAAWQAALLRDHGPQMLVEMIDEAIILGRARQAGIEASPEQVKLRLDSATAMSGGEAGLAQSLRTQGLTHEAFEQRVRLGLLLDALALAGLTVTPPEVEAYYQAHLESYRHGELARGRMILCSSRENAEALRDALQSGGDFAGLAQAFSEDPATQPKSGDMGWFGQGDYAAAITHMAFSLQPGQLSPAFHGPDGWYLLAVEDRRPAGERPLSEVQGEIETMLRYQKLPEERRRWLVERRRQARIVLGDEQFQATVRQLVEQTPAPGSLPF